MVLSLSSGSSSSVDEDGLTSSVVGGENGDCFLGVIDVVIVAEIAPCAL